jgi:hypothetical protein
LYSQLFINYTFTATYLIANFWNFTYHISILTLIWWIWIFNFLLQLHYHIVSKIVKFIFFDLYLLVWQLLFKFPFYSLQGITVNIFLHFFGFCHQTLLHVVLEFVLVFFNRIKFFVFVWYLKQLGDLLHFLKILIFRLVIIYSLLLLAFFGHDHLNIWLCNFSLLSFNWLSYNRS